MKHSHQLPGQLALPGEALTRNRETGQKATRERAHERQNCTELIDAPQTPLLVALRRFTLATPELLADRSLQRRVDTKCMIDEKTLEALLAKVYSEYAILLSGGRARARYETLYLDTPRYRSLEDHHRGRRPRFKARIRHYLDRELSYLEVKEKTRANDTRKFRRRICYGDEKIGLENTSFLDEHLPIRADDLTESLRTRFDRITLLGKSTAERVTLDLDLAFRKAQTRKCFPEAVIVEIKQERFQPRSPIMMALRAARIFPVSVSKYCTAAALLLPEIPMNNYKDTVRALGRIRND